MTVDRPKYLINTFGCQMNFHDSEILAGMLEQMGYCPARSAEEADIILFNTCCVRANAENRAFGNIGNLKPLKKEKPNLIIGVCGCMAQEPSEVEKIRKTYTHVDLVFGTHNLHQLPELLQRVKETRRQVIEVWDKEGEIIEELPVRRESKLKAWVTIMYGCNNFCSYCIVPYVRGRERSRRPEVIVREIMDLVDDGVKEVTLLGQNVNSYGLDREERVDFPDLLQQINEIKGLERIRFTTSHPKDLSDKLIEVMAKGEKICEHLHLPFQAGSNKVLQMMNRRYSREHYLALVEKLRNAIPGIALTTDIIVGYPGETDEDFYQTIDLVKTVRFDGAFTFAYSTRAGTPAARIKEQVPEEVKKERLYKLIEVQNQISGEISRALKDQVVEVLVEGLNEKNQSYLEGRTRTNKLVLFKKPENGERLIGNLVQVKIVHPQTWNLFGELV